MDGEPSTVQSHASEKKKRLRDLSNNGDLLVNRGKPVSEKWKPVWIWLQSLGRTKIVDSAEVTAWLEGNPDYAREMKQFHSHGVLVHYVQKCHQRLVHGRNYKGEGKKPPAVKKPPERRLTNEIRLPNGRFGSKGSTEISEVKQEDSYQLQWSQQLVKNLLPPAKAAKYDLDKTEEASILDAETWRDQWRMLLDSEKSNAEVGSSAELKLEKPNGTSPYSKRIKRPRSVYSPERFDRPMPTSKEKVASLTLDKMDALNKFELILKLEMRLKETLSRCKGSNNDVHETSIGDKLKQGGGGNSRGRSDTHMHAWAFSDASLGNKVHEG